MKKVVALEVTAQTGQVEQSVGNIRKELKGAKSDLIAAQATFGTYSKEALAAAKRVAQLKDQIADANETAALFDPGNKFAAFSNALSAVAGGFAAVQGAQALLGSESEELEKTLVKVQSALALSQGLSQIKDMGKNFGEVSAVIKGPVIAAFTTLRGAIIATGIGALAVGIGLIIANFDKLKNSSGIIGKIFRGIGDAIEFVTGKIEDLTDWLGITASAEEEAAARTKAAAEQQKNAKEAAYNAELAIARATGKGVEEIEARKRKEVLKTLETQSLQLRLLKSVFGDNAPAWIGDALANIEVELTKVRTEQKVAEIEQKKKQDSDAKARNDRAKQELDAQNKLRFELEKARSDAFTAEIMELERQRDERLAVAKNDASLRLQIEQDFQRQVNELRNQSRNEESAGVIVREQLTGMQIAQNQKLNISLKDYSDNVKVTAKQNVEARENEAEQTSQILGNLSQVFGRETAAGKAFAIAEATINTYLGASKALTGIPKGNPLGAVLAITQAAAIIAAGIRNVKAIASTKVPNAPGVNAASGSLANISVPAPIAPQAQTTQLDQSSINAVGNAAAGRAFVLNTDIQNNQERIARLNRAARIN